MLKVSLGKWRHARGGPGRQRDDMIHGGSDRERRRDEDGWGHTVAWGGLCMYREHLGVARK
jgi:hypothetical protein